jgi:hypothetical protein
VGAGMVLSDPQAAGHMPTPANKKVKQFINMINAHKYRRSFG